MSTGHTPSEWSREDEVVLTELLEEAGERQPLSPYLSAIKESVEARWVDSTQPGAPSKQRHSRAWLAAAAAVVVVSAAVLLTQPWSTQSDEPYPTVWSSSGPVAISNERDGTVRSGSEVVTGTGGRATFRLVGTRSLRLDENSRIRFSEARRIELLEGAIYSDSGLEPGADEAVVVTTPLGRITEVGTQYEARLVGEAVRLRVREGRVAFRHSQGDGKSTSVEAGEEVTVRQDGSSARTRHASHGRPWNWVTEAIPRMAIEGETLERLLVWTAREGGWTLRFGDHATRLEARQVVLHGSIEGLSLLEGLDAAIEGSGLAAQVEGSELVVERLRTSN